MKRIVRMITPVAAFACLVIAVPYLPSAPTADDTQDQPVPIEPEIVVPAGTRVPLVMINSISSKHSEPGDPVYLESVYPVVVSGRVLLPAGTNVSGSVIRSKRPGRVKGRGVLNIRLEQMILPNGVIRDLTGRPGALDGRSPDNFDRETGTVKSAGSKGEDAQDVAEVAAAGASIGTIAGAVSGRVGPGLGIGAAAGAAAGVAKVLLTRGSDAALDRGTHIEMLLEQDLHFGADEMPNWGAGTRSGGSIGAGPDRRRNERYRPNIGGRGTGIGRLPL